MGKQQSSVTRYRTSNSNNHVFSYLQLLIYDTRRSTLNADSIKNQETYRSWKKRIDADINVRSFFFKNQEIMIVTTMPKFIFGFTS